MSTRAIFEGLVFDQNDHPVDVTIIGNEACYVIDDNGFHRHISAEFVDRQVYDILKDQFLENKDAIIDQAAKMLGQDDIFSQAVLAKQMENVDQHFDLLMKLGIQENDRAYLGMVGFKITINLHGEVIDLKQPNAPDPDQE